MSVAGAGARVNREADGGAPETERVLPAARHRAAGLVHLGQHVAVVQLQDEGHLADEARSATRLEGAEGRGVGVAARVDGELEVVVRVVRRGVGREE